MHIVNTTFTFTISTKFDLKFIASQLWDSEYDPRKFPSIIMKLRFPKCSTLISKNGHVVIVGCKSKQEAIRAKRIVVKRIVRVLKCSVSLTALCLKNLVGSGKHTFNLSQHWNRTHNNISHESELFPGIIVRLSGGMSATIFRRKEGFDQGTFFITGAKSMDDLESAHLELLMTF